MLDKALSMLLFTGLVCVSILSAPKRNINRRTAGRLLLLAGGTLACYGAGSLAIMFAGWFLSGVAFFGDRPRRGAAGAVLGASTLCFAAALVILAIAHGPSVLLAPLGSDVIGSGQSARWAFVSMGAAVLLRSGIFPFHFWVVSAFSVGDLLPIGLLFTAQSGVELLVRFMMPAFGETARLALPLIGDLALMSALLTAFLSFGERQPRRVLGLLAASQSSFVLAGIATATGEGIAGALVHSSVVLASLTALLVIYRSLEARCSAALDSEAGGLASRAPRLAVFFIVSGLALIGLPGTLGFPGTDLLFHGALESHPYLGLALPIATALTAIRLFWLFTTIFLGRALKATPPVPDALPRERWALTAVVLFLVGTGLVPNRIVSAKASVAHGITASLPPASEAP